MVPIDNGTTWNLLTHYGQVYIENTRAHTVTYVNTPTRDMQDNNMFYYFLADLLTIEFCIVEPKTTLVDLGPITHVILDDQEPTSLDPHDELLQWHYRLGHLSFECIQQLAQLGQLPKRLLASKKPFCSACQYGKMMKRPWRVKGDDKNSTKTATRPGQIVSVDQLESNSLGFITQLKGKLTQQRYKYVTVFVDQFYGYTFVYLQRRIMSKEMVMAKHAFECAAEQHGVKLLHCHADNGRFADNAFIADCNAQ